MCGKFLLGTRQYLVRSFESPTTNIRSRFPRGKLDRARSRATPDAKMAAAYPGQARVARPLVALSSLYRYGFGDLSMMSIVSLHFRHFRSCKMPQDLLS